MSAETQSERLFHEFCVLHGIPCVRVTPNDEDGRELAELPQGVAAGRLVPNRLRAKLKNVSAQLKSASDCHRPTLLVVYDNTPFHGYLLHADVVEAMFGRNSVSVIVPTDPSLPPQISNPFFGGDRGMGPERNTAVSAIAILDGSPKTALTLRVYHNPYAAVRLDPGVFSSLPVTQPVLPDTPGVSP
jgi:hypothetical protein